MQSVLDSVSIIIIVVFIIIIFIRGAHILAIKAGIEDIKKEAAIIAVVLAFMMGGATTGWSSAKFGLLLFTTFIAVYTIVTGGIAAGALIQHNPIGAIPAMMLIITTILLGFIEPLLIAPFYSLALGLNIYLEYRDMYGVLHSTLWSDEIVHYIFVYPPLVLLFTITDIIILTPRIGQITTTIIIAVCVIIGMIYGYQQRTYYS